VPAQPHGAVGLDGDGQARLGFLAPGVAAFRASRFLGAEVAPAQVDLVSSEFIEGAHQ